MSCKSKRKHKKYGMQQKTIFGYTKPQWKGEKTDKQGNTTTIILKESNRENQIRKYKRVRCRKCGRSFWAGKYEHAPICRICVQRKLEEEREKFRERFR